MKKVVVIFSLLLTAKAFSMDPSENELSKALGALDFPKIEELCRQGAIDFKKEVSIIYTSPACQFATTKTPFDFALSIHSLALGELLEKHGAQPEAQAYDELCIWGHYKFLPIVYKYHPNRSHNFFGGNLLHKAVNCQVPENTHKLIAAILLFFPEYTEEKKHFSQGSHGWYESKELTPLEYAKSGWSSFSSSAQKVAEILEDEKLLTKTKEEVSSEFKLNAVQQLGVSNYLEGRRLGLSFAEIKEAHNFKKRQQARISGKKEE